jgi:outer membrane protein TolC
MKRWLTIALLAPAMAMAVDYADLPPSELVEKVLRAHPAVVAAQAGIDVGAAARDQLEAGPHEFNLRLGSARRREVASDLRLPERQIGVERAFRLPGKASKDAQIGAAVLDQAQSAYGDSLHETARLLLGAWFDWRREQAAAVEWQEQVELLRQQNDIATKRVAAGDAARIEILLTSAQQTQAEAQLAQAQSRARLAAGTLAQHFPSLPLPANVGSATTEPISASFDLWREKLLEHNHELQVARAVARRQQLQAQRSDADRLPDPTLGVTWSSERDGQERVVGVALSIPLPGGARFAAARGAQAESAAAAAREAQTHAKVEGEARRSFQLAQSLHGQSQRLAEVAARIGENTRLLEKAWRFGEGQISDLLTARRQAVDARLAAAQAQLDASEARYRLLLDAHELWAFDGPEPDRR